MGGMKDELDVVMIDEMAHSNTRSVLYFMIRSLIPPSFRRLSTFSFYHLHHSANILIFHVIHSNGYEMCVSFQFN